MDSVSSGNMDSVDRNAKVKEVCDYNLHSDVSVETTGSVNSKMSMASSHMTKGTGLTSVTAFGRILKPQLSLKSFDYRITDLIMRRTINRSMDLHEMVKLEYIAGGSHSQVFSAVWEDQAVVIKVTLLSILPDFFKSLSFTRFCSLMYSLVFSFQLFSAHYTPTST
jgi:hypothetical protein